MRTYHLLLLDDASGTPRRVEFRADSPDQAFQVARNERDGIHVELWESDRLLVRMSKDGAVWKLLPTPDFTSPLDAFDRPAREDGAAAMR